MEHRSGAERSKPPEVGSAAGRSAAGGFQGALGSLPLADLLQVWSMNRFSGMVSVTSPGHAGRLYFVDGEMVHAEADGTSGEPALAVILGWPNGVFEPFPNTATLERTIQKRLSHLLLDAHRVLDEQRRAAATPPPLPGAPSKEPSRTPLIDRIRAIHGVTGLVRFGADGRPAGECGPDAEALAAKALYLAMNHAGAVARAFGLRELVVASVQGKEQSLVVVHSHGHYLGVSVDRGVAADSVAAQIRAILTRPAAR